MERSQSFVVTVKRVCLVVLLISAITPYAKAQNPIDTKRRGDTVAARVNAREIMLSEVDRQLDQQSRGKRAQLSQVELEKARLQALDTMIQREVLFQRAEKEGLLPTDARVMEAINEQKQRSGMNNKELSTNLNERNLTLDELREGVKGDLAIRALHDKYSAGIRISDREVEDYYDKNRQEFVIRRGVALAMIVVDPMDNSAEGITNDAKGEDAAKIKINGIFRQLRNGADFAILARTKSEDADSLVRGGDIGLATGDDLRRNGFPRPLINMFFGMRVGSFTAPSRFSSPNFRWYIFKIQDRVMNDEKLTLDSPGVRAQITMELVKQRKDIINAALLTTTMNEAKIVNYLAARRIGNQ